MYSAQTPSHTHTSVSTPLMRCHQSKAIQRNLRIRIPDLYLHNAEQTYSQTSGAIKEICSLDFCTMIYKLYQSMAWGGWHGPVPTVPEAIMGNNIQYRVLLADFHRVAHLSTHSWAAQA